MSEEEEQKEQAEHWERFNSALKHIAKLSPEQVKEIQEAVPEPKDLRDEDLKGRTDKNKSGAE